jgi:acetylglutamate kinase
MRVTDQATLEVVRKVIQAENLRLVEALEEMGTRARPISSGVFSATLRDRETLGFVGDVNAVDLDPIRSSIRSGTLPILTSLGETQDGQIVNINADVAARELAIAIAPFKIIFLTSTGGLLNGEGEVVEAISLREDYENLISKPWLHSGMLVKIREIKELLDQLPLESSVSMTRADQLARELFTHRGSGTLIRRGESIIRANSWAELDQDRFTDLIRGCFERPLVDNYFSHRNPLAVYLSEQYRATAVIVSESELPYLDKFATTPKAQGEGLGHSLWRRMRRDFPTLFWRSRTSNPVNGWYFQQASGSYRTDRWTVFWYGLEDFSQISRCVHHALELPETLKQEAQHG